MSSKKNLKMAIDIFLYALFIALWCFVSIAFIRMHQEGILSAITDAFGKITFYIWVMFGILSLLSIIWLRFAIKKRWVVNIIAYALTVAFAVSGVLLSVIGDNKFSEFTSENWSKYPSRRMTMYFDLEEKNILKGASDEFAIDLLGKPNTTYIPEDTNEYDIVYVYDDGYGNSVYIYMKDKVVVNSGYVE